MGLRLIESVNVVLTPGKLTRQMGRHHRGVLHRPQMVTIRPTRERIILARDEASYRRLTERHPVRGHFKHYSEENRLWTADPESVVWHPTRGAVVQVWCPPYIAGPPGAPIRLKVWKLDGYIDTGAC